MARAPFPAVLALAHDQHGWVTAAQLERQGWTHHEVVTAVARGSLRRQARGIYSLPGAADSLPRRAMFGHLAGGEGAVVSHLTAAALLGLDGVPDGGPVHVSVPHGRRPRHPALVVHDSRDLTHRHLTTVEGGIPCTSVVRTLIDLGAVAEPAVVERATESALRRGATSTDYLFRRLELVGRRGRRGAGVLRGVLVDRGGAPPTDSDLETVAVQLFRDEAGIDFERQVELVAGYRVDLGDRALMIGCELDGYRWHRTREQLLADASRQNRLVLAGVLMLRFGWEHVHLRRHRAGVIETARRAVMMRRGTAPSGWR